jgi:hypothetical protein
MQSRNLFLYFHSSFSPTLYSIYFKPSLLLPNSEHITPTYVILCEGPGLSLYRENHTAEGNISPDYKIHTHIFLLPSNYNTMVGSGSHCVKFSFADCTISLKYLSHPPEMKFLWAPTYLLSTTKLP